MRLCNPSGVVGRAIVDHDHVDRGVEPLDLVHDETDRSRFVPSWHDRYEPLLCHACTPASSPTSSSNRRARERVLDEHTYAHRARRLLELVGLEAGVRA